MTDLLLIHAFPVDSGMWDDQTAELGKDAHVIAPNLPGFGGTAGVGDTMSMDAAADFLVSELDREGVDRAVVCGLSMGGYIAFSLWRNHRDRISGLVLADTRAEADDDAGKEKRRGLAEKVRAEGSQPLVEAPPPLLSEGADPRLWDRVKQMIGRQSGDAIAAAALGMADRIDSRPILGEIDVPTTVIVGGSDTLTPPEMSETVAKGISGADLVTLEGAGHLSNLEDPQGFNAAVKNLLSRAG
ncbi:MAG: alpha/beta fold hydrolase [Actinomycetota bacterium]